MRANAGMRVCDGCDMFMCVFLIIKEIRSLEVYFFFSSHKKWILVSHPDLPSGEN